MTVISIKSPIADLYVVYYEWCLKIETTLKVRTIHIYTIGHIQHQKPITVTLNLVVFYVKSCESPVNHMSASEIHVC